MIQNGSMLVDQLGLGPVTSDFERVCDKFFLRFANVGSQTVSAERVTDAPSGFAYSIKATMWSGGAPSASTFAAFQYVAEGLDFAQLGWGSSSGVDIALGIWAKSSVTGARGVAIESAAVPTDNYYIAPYTINTANTWEFKELLIPAPPSGSTWALTSNGYVRFSFDFGSGSDFQATGQSWGTGDRRALSGSARVIDTSGATFQIAGFSAIAGDQAIATPDRTPYAVQEEICRRYLQAIDVDYLRYLGISDSSETAYCPLRFASRFYKPPSTLTIPGASTGAGQMYFSTPTFGVPGTLGTHGYAHVTETDMILTASGYAGLAGSGGAAPLWGNAAKIIADTGL